MTAVVIYEDGLEVPFQVDTVEEAFQLGLEFANAEGFNSLRIETDATE